jgi:hypothetical protein
MSLSFIVLIRRQFVLDPLEEDDLLILSPFGFEMIFYAASRANQPAAIEQYKNSDKTTSFTSRDSSLLVANTLAITPFVVGG